MDRSEWLRMRLALWPDLAAAESPDSEADLWLAHGGTVVLVADRPGDSGLAGFAEVGHRDYADGCDTAPVAYLEAWYVEPDLRGQGIGAALVRAAETWARDQRLSELASDALLDNIPSQHAHRALGFEEVERSVKYRKKL